MWIFLSGKLSAPTVEEEYENVQEAIAVAIKLMKKGHIVIIPHLTQYIADHPDCDLPRTYEFWVDWWDFAHIRLCDALFLMENWEDSVGALKEVAYATQLGLPMFITLDEVPNHSDNLDFQRALAGKSKHKWRAKEYNVERLRQ